MSHFYGSLKGGRGEVTRTGHKTSGIETYAATWNGAIRVVVYWSELDKCDKFRVERTTWQGKGDYTAIANGTFGPEPIQFPVGHNYKCLAAAASLAADALASNNEKKRSIARRALNASLVFAKADGALSQMAEKLTLEEADRLVAQIK